MDNANEKELNILLSNRTPKVKDFFHSIDRMLNRIEKLAKKSRLPLQGERYLTDQELSERLKVSRRSLQDYRSEGKIPYYQIGAKILYKESDIEKMLRDNFRDVFKK